ncbi:HNH endonuclease [Chromohalobacter israelensis]|uniref:HNH endonuclease n=1 Tax=Chromohalobacter israelensis TaxID=141390 RepID=UPI001C4F7104|nr:HNH endonuclease [Chromohalobacter salexigens]
MNSIETLKPGTVLDNSQLCELFRCSPQGGMRRSRRTNTLVIVTNHVESIYDDRWEGNVIHYTGMGQSGEMDLNFAQNRTLNESPGNGVAVHLFEVFKKREYTYIGEVERIGPAYQAEQPDSNGEMRLAWLFPLQLKDNTPALLDTGAAGKTFQKRERQARKLSDSELLSRAKKAPATAGSRTVITAQYGRSPYVAAYAKRRAAGICELCEKPAPFITKDGEPYLECHHIEWLARGGEDTIENTVALCPNCHRKMHVLNNSTDITHLNKKTGENIDLQNQDNEPSFL